jgi:hypothetical protein
MGLCSNLGTDILFVFNYANRNKMNEIWEGLVKLQKEKTFI